MHKLNGEKTKMSNAITTKVKTKTAVAIALVTLAVGSIAAGVYTLAPILKSKSVMVISPNGGEVWKVGETHRISWSSKGVKSVKINLAYISTGGVPGTGPGGGAGAYVPYNIAQVSASQGYYDWKIKSEQLPVGISGGSYQIEIKATDKNVFLSDFSDAPFSIINPTSSSCTDSDGGRIYNRRGTVSLSLTSQSQTDSCTYCTGLCPPTGPCPLPTCGAVTEYFCENNAIKSEDHICQNSTCIDGACIDNTAPPSAPGGTAPGSNSY